MRELGIKNFEKDAERLAVALAGAPGIKQFYPLSSEWNSGSFNGDSFSTISTATQMDISTFTGAPADTSHIRAILVRVVCRDSAAWGTGSLYFSCGPSATRWYAFDVWTFGGDLWIASQGIVPTDANGDVWYKIGASGASTFELFFEIWGYWT